jgi:uncharacterized membrane-anchored protein
MTSEAQRLGLRQMLNKVPEVTLYFWVIKVLCTTVGETASDYLSDNVGLGLTKTTYITAALLLATLVVQFRMRRYVAGIYWTGIVLISVVGTQITDNLTDNHGVSLVTTTALFSILLAIVFSVWWLSERTLSIHTIYTTRREGFYWLAVLFTFALGTAAGDLTAERLNVGYFWSLVLFAGAIALVVTLHYAPDLNAVLAFWIAYILTRPLGASLIRRARPQISVWFHQHMDLVDESGDSAGIERRFAALVGLPLARLVRERGSVVGWENHTLPGTTAFVVELPAGSLPAAAVRRYAEAVVAVTR